MHLGTVHIDKVLDLISEKEISQLSTKWKQSKIAPLLMIKMACIKDKLEKNLT